MIILNEKGGDDFTVSKKNFKKLKNIFNNYKERQAMTTKYFDFKLDCTEKDKKIIKAKARHLNLSVSDYIRLKLGFKPLYDEPMSEE